MRPQEARSKSDVEAKLGQIAAKASELEKRDRELSEALAKVHAKQAPLAGRGGGPGGPGRPGGERLAPRGAADRGAARLGDRDVPGPRGPRRRAGGVGSAIHRGDEAARGDPGRGRGTAAEGGEAAGGRPAARDGRGRRGARGEAE